MTNKEIMKNKVQHLEQALLETSFTMNRMQETINTQQKQIDIILGPRGVMRLSLDGEKSSTRTLRCLRATA